MLYKKIKSKRGIYFFMLLFFALLNFPLNFSLGAPSIQSISEEAVWGEPLNINGSEFGTKEVSEAITFNDFDTETVGQVPRDWLSPLSTDCLIRNDVYRGLKSLDCSAINFSGTEYFPRITLDLGRNIETNDYLYFTTWIYLTNPGMQFNWKGPLLTSSTTPNYWVLGTTTNNATGIGAWWSNDENRWFNPTVTIQYSQDSNSAFNYCTSGNGAASDSYLFGEWQRIEYEIKTSSSATVNDGYVKVNRFGKSTPTTNATGCITHGNTSDPWRYFSLPQGITNIPNNPFNIQMHFDDLYIDNSLSRVEICNESTWSTANHCEIQKIQSWSDGSIGIILNKGSLESGENLYLYIFDSSGSVDNVGFPITIISSDNFAPNAPTGLNVI